MGLISYNLMNLWALQRPQSAPPVHLNEESDFNLHTSNLLRHDPVRDARDVGEAEALFAGLEHGGWLQGDATAEQVHTHSHTHTHIHT